MSDGRDVDDPDISSEIFNKTAEVIRAYDNAFGASVKASQAFFDLQTILPPCMRMGVITGIPPSTDVEMPSGDEQYILTQPQSSASNTLGSSATSNSAKIRITSTKSRQQEQAAFDSDLLSAFQAVYERRIAYDKISQKKLAIELNELSNGKTAIVQDTNEEAKKEAEVEAELKPVIEKETEAKAELETKPYSFTSNDGFLNSNLLTEAVQTSNRHAVPNLPSIDQQCGKIIPLLTNYVS
ncbi:9025_t:CDS:2 [Ambispora gerdemannii]|uniref:9025_t:CDS:1 n=1 Tax=Ambispora gerdemannii TaxID=144530 RepID=A0A9N8Z6Q2_9GLOM|nr:9025_t:CDS:2 [Ambispora gerdemannii]